MQHDFVWCTYVSTPDYIIPALTLGENLKRVHSQYPLVIAMTENVFDPYQNLIREMGCIPEKIKTVEYHKDLQEGLLKNHRLLNTSSRVSVFELTQYGKMVFLDADVLMAERCDDLFNRHDGSMCFDRSQNGRGGFEGLLIFCPTHHCHGLYAELIKAVPITTDQLFASLWFPIRTNKEYEIPAKYFYHYGAAVYQGLVSQVKIFHFAENKPWEMSKDDPLYNTKPLQYYLRMYNEVRDKVHQIDKNFPY